MIDNRIGELFGKKQYIGRTGEITMLDCLKRHIKQIQIQMSH